MKQTLPSSLRPLGLHRVLTPPERSLDIAPLFDVLLIFLMFLLLGSRFVFAPGLSIALPESSEKRLSGIPTVDVLTVKSDQFIIFQGRKYTLKTLARQFDEGRTAPLPEGAFLLVRADQVVDMQTFARISELAKAIGYTGVQLAVREEAMPDAAHLNERELLFEP